MGNKNRNNKTKKKQIITNEQAGEWLLKRFIDRDIELTKACEILACLGGRIELV